MFKPVEEWLEKSSASKAAKAAMKKAMDALNEAKAEFDPEQFKACKKAFGMLDEEEQATEKKKAEDEMAEVKKSAETEVTQIKEIVQKSVAALDTATPEVKVALDALSAVVGYTPTHQLITTLPESVKAQIVELQKSAADANKRFEELQKSQAEHMRAERHRTMLAKAASLPHVPLATDALADLMMAATESKAGESLEKLLTAVECALAKSALLTETGSSMSGNAGSVHARVEKMAEEVLQKSLGTEKVLSKAQAVSAVYDANPELYHEWEREHRAALGKMGV